MTNPTSPSHVLLFAFVSALSGALGCVSNSDPATGGSGGSATGGSSSSTGGSTSATGGSGGQSSAAAFPCAAPVAMVTDFTYTAGAAADTASFGDYTTTFSGGTFIYPTTGTYALKSDVTQGNWHVTGSVGDYSGMGLFFSGVNPATGMTGGCGKVDASAFKGIQFSISGDVPMGNTVTLTVGTAGDDVASAWLNAHKAVATDPDKEPNFGRCMPATNQYDGTCGAPTKAIPVGATPKVEQVLWTELMGGKPEAALNPTEITFFSWVLPTPAGAGTTAPTPYTVDITIDDLQFIP